MVAYALIQLYCCHRIFNGLSLLFCGYIPADFNFVFLYTALLNLLQVQQGVMEGRLTIFLHTLAWAWTLFASTEDRRLSSETVQAGLVFFTPVAGLNSPDRGNFSVNIFLCHLVM